MLNALIGRGKKTTSDRGLFGRTLLMHGRAVHALLLRDIKTRMGSSYFGFLLGLILPLGHLFIVLGLYLALGRRAAIGTDVIMFLSSAILPFIIWSYTHQKIVQSFGQNLPLTSFPIVKLVDIFISRSIVELLTSAFISLVVIIFVLNFSNDFFIDNIIYVFLGLIMSYFLGLSTGYSFGLLSIIAPVFGLIGFLIIPIFWVTSGVLFVPGALPEIARSYLSVFALAHIVDFIRVAIYPSYISDFSNIYYAIGAIIVNISVCMIANYFGKTILQR